MDIAGKWVKKKERTGVKKSEEEANVERKGNLIWVQ